MFFTKLDFVYWHSKIVNLMLKKVSKFHCQIKEQCNQALLGSISHRSSQLKRQASIFTSSITQAKLIKVSPKSHNSQFRWPQSEAEKQMHEHSRVLGSIRGIPFIKMGFSVLQLLCFTSPLSSYSMSMNNNCWLSRWEAHSLLRMWPRHVKRIHFNASSWHLNPERGEGVNMKPKWTSS